MKKVLFLCGTVYDGLIDIAQFVFDNPIFLLNKTEKKDIINYYNTKLCLGKNFFMTSNNDIISQITTFNPDIIVSIGWRTILKNSFFSHFSMKTLINIHPAILPEYKGYHTEPYVIINNEKIHGVTAHFLTEQLDSGDIILQRKFPINEYDTVKSLKSKINKIMPTFFKDLFNILLNEKINPIPQKGLNKIVAPKRNPTDSQIDCNDSITDLYNYIRACDPDNFPAYFIRPDGVKVYIKLWTDRADKDSEYEL